MYLLTGVILALIALITRVVIAIDAKGTTSYEQRREKCALDTLIENERMWINTPLCPIRREGRKLILTAPRNLYLHGGKTLLQFHNYVVKYGQDKVEKKWGIVDAASGRLIYAPDTIWHWWSEKHEANWERVDDTHYRCSGCGNVVRAGHTGVGCTACGCTINNLIR